MGAACCYTTGFTIGMARTKVSSGSTLWLFTSDLHQRCHLQYHMIAAGGPTIYPQLFPPPEKYVPAGFYVVGSKSFKEGGGVQYCLYVPCCGSSKRGSAAEACKQPGQLTAAQWRCCCSRYTPNRVDVIGVHCYSSIDLVTWRDEGAPPTVPLSAMAAWLAPLHSAFVRHN